MALTLIPAIHRATHAIGLHIERIAGVPLTQGEAHILAHLLDHGECRVGALHRALAHRRSTLTSILDRLVDRGMVTREVSPADRRSFLVALTGPGRRIGAIVHARLQALEAAALGDGDGERILAALAAVERAASVRGTTG